MSQIWIFLVANQKLVVICRCHSKPVSAVKNRGRRDYTRQRILAISISEVWTSSPQMEMMKPGPKLCQMPLRSSKYTGWRPVNLWWTLPWADQRAYPTWTVSSESCKSHGTTSKFSVAMGIQEDWLWRKGLSIDGLVTGDVTTLRGRHLWKNGMICAVLKAGRSMIFHGHQHQGQYEC